MCIRDSLYILPQKQNKGYGTKLLQFAITKCMDTPTPVSYTHLDVYKRQLRNTHIHVQPAVDDGAVRDAELQLIDLNRVAAVFVEQSHLSGVLIAHAKIPDLPSLPEGDCLLYTSRCV